eukprot:NODE_8487_length_673_cov_33.763636_g7863_i0.p1 GENE.NODE_8487_length_673_cov_33.763636_g7863_i0~~NODE_8487_length_673_cov_33.763636_g7863_i0.p1  ORF type:complete len:175 (-),score=41.55 NODE_8487_length_673_cov_33.763636_g7863_i0:147-641(-)
MLCSDGRMFHVDFGFVFGKDPRPKVFAAPIRLSKDMVVAMGGFDSPLFAQFQDLAVSGYLILRKNARFVLHMLALMGDCDMPCTMTRKLSVPSSTSFSSIWNINNNDGGWSVPWCASKAQQNLRLDLDEAGARNHFIDVIRDSVKSLIPEVVEILHGVANMIRD